MTFGQWNVRTLLDREGTGRPERRTALVAMELEKYKIDIAALSETRFSESGRLDDMGLHILLERQAGRGTTRGWSGIRHQKRDLSEAHRMPKAVNDRIMTMTVPLTKKGNATVISIYANQP